MGWGLESLFVGLGVGWWSVWVDVGVVDFVRCEVWGSLFRCGVGDGKGGWVWGDMWGLTVRKRGNVYSERHTVVSCLVGSYAAQSTVVEMSLIIPTPAQSYRESYKHLRRKRKRTPESPFPRLPSVCGHVYPCLLAPKHLAFPRPTMNALPFGRQKQPEASSAEYPQPISSVPCLLSQPRCMSVPRNAVPKFPAKILPTLCPCVYKC